MASDPGCSPRLDERRQSASLNAWRRDRETTAAGSESQCTRTCMGANTQIY